MTKLGLSLKTRWGMRKHLIEIIKGLLLLGLAIFIREIIGFFCSDVAPFITLFPVIVVSGVFFGTIAASVTAILGILITDYLWVPPRDAFWPDSPNGFIDIALFLLASGCIIWTTHLLRLERDRIRQYFEVAGTMVGLLDRNGLIRQMNQHGFELLANPDPRDIYDRVRLQDYLLEEDKPRFRAALAETQAPKGQARCEVRMVGEGESERILHFRLIATHDSRTRPCILAVADDVTEERNATQALATNEQRLRAVLQNLPAAVAILEGPTGRAVLRSDRSQGILGHAERNVDSFKKLASYGGIHPDGRSYAPEEYPITRALLFGERVEGEDLSYRRPDGSVATLEVHAAPVLDPTTQNEIIAAVGIAFDVTARKNAETALREALNARELLFREADHRIKNSLQMIVSLLQLQKRRAEDDRLRATLDDVIARVNSVAEVHSALQESSDFRVVAFGDILRSICRRLDGLKNGVDLQCRCLGQLLLDAERAIPLGLIASEVITNALRHAYPSGGPGLVVVDAVLEADALTMTIADDGIGMPNERGHGLGSTIIRALTVQIKAQVSLDSQAGRGTRFTIQVPGTSISATDSHRDMPRDIAIAPNCVPPAVESGRR